MPKTVDLTSFAAVSHEVSSTVVFTPQARERGRKFYKFEKNGIVKSVSNENERSSLSQVAKAATQSVALMSKLLDSSDEAERKSTKELDQLIAEAKEISGGLQAVSQDVNYKIATLKASGSFGDKVRYQLHQLRDKLYSIFNSKTPEKIIENKKLELDGFIKQAETLKDRAQFQSEKELKESGSSSDAMASIRTTDRKDARTTFIIDVNEVLKRNRVHDRKNKIAILTGRTDEEVEKNLETIFNYIDIQSGEDPSGDARFARMEITRLKGIWKPTVQDQDT